MPPPAVRRSAASSAVWATVRFSRGLYGKAPDPAFLERVLRDPVVHGATVSLLGPDPFLFGRYCHANGPG